jgi:hypothetical protein
MSGRLFSSYLLSPHFVDGDRYRGGKIPTPPGSERGARGARATRARGDSGGRGWVRACPPSQGRDGLQRCWPGRVSSVCGAIFNTLIYTSVPRPTHARMEKYESAGVRCAVSAACFRAGTHEPCGIRGGTAVALRAEWALRFRVPRMPRLASTPGARSTALIQEVPTTQAQRPQLKTLLRRQPRLLCLQLLARRGRSIRLWSMAQFR